MSVHKSQPKAKVGDLIQGCDGITLVTKLTETVTRFSHAPDVFVIAEVVTSTTENGTRHFYLLKDPDAPKDEQVRYYKIEEDDSWLSQEEVHQLKQRIPPQGGSGTAPPKRNQFVPKSQSQHTAAKERPLCQG